MMPSEFEGGEVTRSSDGDFDGGLRPELVRQALSYWIELSKRADGKASLEFAALSALGGSPERASVLQEIVAAICPPVPMVEVWKDWMSGGRPPLSSAPLLRPGSGKRASKQVSDRRARTNDVLQSRINDARHEVDQANQRLRQAEEALETSEMNQRAELMWTMSQTMVEIMMSGFALGPAWTIMRALSSHVGEEEMRMATAFSVDAAHMIELKEEALNGKKEETELLLEVLDARCGDPDFELDVRKAILNVVTEYRDKPSPPDGPVYKRRSKEAARRTVSPNGLQDKEAILHGLQR